ncbi:MULTISPECIES: hypothetical protein [Acinetobacter]|uniref:hypothetical protein n=1 Tax=Acinetobacter TaxID=469 RepID=UPI00070771F4|nr:MULTISPECIES: hypothetical protein [Acinetobacter]KQE99795.1 hypothetical protein APB99_13780 [Acinetobacter pittii]KRI32974.1 hypothetical protein APB87_18150 [Acinetobacter pittii]MDR0001600.1 hypothetical protein [Acinetobacter sp. 11367]OID24569.1 hypothetical protein A7L44_03920 [Acinetobacter pittii]
MIESMTPNMYIKQDFSAEIAGFAFCWNEVVDLSKKGETFTISGTPYKIIELDVVEKGASHE